MNRLIGVAPLLLVLSGLTHAELVVYTNEELFLSQLAALDVSIIHESFEDGNVWSSSRNSIPSPGSTSAVTSQGIVWSSNYSQNNIATGTVGGSAPDGDFAFYSLPHGMTVDSGLYCDSAEDPNIPIECYQNDGVIVQSESGELLYGFGGRIDTANNGKVTFLLDGVDINGNDTDNINNWQREGDWADSWAFVGVIDTDGFFRAELRELRGKDFQQVLLFSDDFTMGRITVAEASTGDFDGNGKLEVIDVDMLREQIAAEIPDIQFDVTHDSFVNGDDLTAWVKDLKRTWFGDANLDGEFNSSDLVEVFEAGEYEDDIAMNSGWSEGDWDGNAEFDTSDLVVAFMDGGYEQGPRRALAAVPEPNGIAMMTTALALTVVSSTRRRGRRF